MVTSKDLEMERIRRGERVKVLRTLTGFSQKNFCATYQISRDTLQSLELGRLLLSKKNAERLCEVAQEAGILCTAEWLLTGRGLLPRRFTDVQASLVNGEESSSFNAPCDEETILAAEIETFKKVNPKAIVLVVRDDAMMPLYHCGSYVGGRQVFGADIDRLTGENCIVLFEDDTSVFRHFGKRAEGYMLTSLNPSTTAPEPHMMVVRDQIKSIAPVFWHRRSPFEVLPDEGHGDVRTL